ncbi:MerR family transcriptional regulator [Streptomyces sp. NBC_00457]|uniref:MerR family transcriptional regulator n=1 Tax=Streptomyces sp. NBC_00457 TaxID=2975748 RepID=UPI002E230868
MRLAELSRRSTVSIATIKYYLRSGLLLPGERITATWADYGEHHLHRLRLIRALIGVGRLSVSATKEILDAITVEQNDPDHVIAKVLNAGSAVQEHKQAEGAATPAKRDTNGLTDARSLIAEMGWCVPRAAPAAKDLGDILDALAELGVDIEWQTLLSYARLADEISKLDSHQIHGGAGASLQAQRAALSCRGRSGIP